jgi:hypothetical protein
MMSSDATLIRICDLLQRFGLPAAIADLRQNRLTSANQELLDLAGYTRDDLKQLPASELLVLERMPSLQTAGLSAQTLAQHGRCALKRGAVDTPLTGYFLERSDQVALLMFDSCVFTEPGEEFFRGRIVGRTEENQAIRERFHQTINQQLVAAALAVESVRASLLERCPDQADVMQRIARLLNESILGVQEALRQQNNLTETSTVSRGVASE